VVSDSLPAFGPILLPFRLKSFTRSGDKLLHKEPSKYQIFSDESRKQLDMCA